MGRARSQPPQRRPAGRSTRTARIPGAEQPDRCRAGGRPGFSRRREALTAVAVAEGQHVGSAADPAEGAEDPGPVVVAQHELVLLVLGEGEGHLGREVVQQLRAAFLLVLQLLGRKFVDDAEAGGDGDGRSDKAVPREVVIAQVGREPGLAGVEAGAAAMAKADFGLDREVVPESPEPAPGRRAEPEIVVPVDQPGLEQQFTEIRAAARGAAEHREAPRGILRDAFRRQRQRVAGPVRRTGGRAEETSEHQEGGRPGHRRSPAHPAILHERRETQSLTKFQQKGDRQRFALRLTGRPGSRHRTCGRRHLRGNAAASIVAGASWGA